MWKVYEVQILVSTKFYWRQPLPFVYIWSHFDGECGPLDLKYLLSGPSREKFTDPWTRLLETGFLGSVKWGCYWSTTCDVILGPQRPPLLCHRSGSLVIPWCVEAWKSVWWGILQGLSEIEIRLLALRKHSQTFLEITLDFSAQREGSKIFTGRWLGFHWIWGTFLCSSNPPWFCQRISEDDNWWEIGSVRITDLIPFEVWVTFICFFFDFNLLPGPWNNSNNHEHCVITQARPEGCASLDKALNCWGAFCGGNAHLHVPVRIVNSRGSGLPGLSGRTKHDSLGASVPFSLLFRHLGMGKASIFSMAAPESWSASEVGDWN